MNVMIGSVSVFNDSLPDKAQALKPLEEAAEVFGAWQILDSCVSVSGMNDVVSKYAKSDLIDEIADTITACCNLASALDVHDLTDAMEACAQRNRARGRM